MAGLFIVLLAVLFTCAMAMKSAFNATTSLADYDPSQAKIALYLSAAAYCGKDAYESHTFTGPTTGFVVTKVLSDPKTDMEGFVGYLPSDNSIQVVFRGSSSIRNWIANVDVFKTDYTTFPECNCQVHKGFYEATQNVFPDVWLAVGSLTQKFPSYTVKVTGHSLGAAVAQLTSMELKKAGVNAQVYNFGQPRVGDEAYATFGTNVLPTWRITHNKDIVPHIPMTEGMDFFHLCREAFEDANGNVRACSTESCEDKTCADQYKPIETNVDDHLTYLGLRVSCDAVSSK